MGPGGGPKGGRKGVKLAPFGVKLGSKGVPSPGGLLGPYALAHLRIWAIGGSERGPKGVNLGLKRGQFRAQIGPFWEALLRASEQVRSPYTGILAYRAPNRGPEWGPKGVKLAPFGVEKGSKRGQIGSI